MASMINWVSSATNKITDFNVGSVTRTMLEAVAIELEELYYQLLRAVEEAIEEAIYRTFNFPRNPAQKATGNVRFTRLAGTETEITINRGTLVSNDTDPVIYFETQAEDKISAITGYATGGSTTSLQDFSKNWVTEGVQIGSRVKKVDGGETQSAGVTSISTTTNTNDTLNFSTLTSGSFEVVTLDRLIWDASSWNPVTTTWTMVTTGPLVHITGNTIPVTATLTMATVIGTIYEVTITGTGGGDTATYTLGGQVGSTIPAGGAIAITDYLTASAASSSLVITPTNTCTVSLTLVRVKALTGSCPFNKVYYDDNGVITEYTSNSLSVDSIYVPVELVAGEDYIYLGSSNMFFGFYSDIGSGTPQAVSSTMVVQYWNGYSWAHVNNLVDGTKGVSVTEPFSITGLVYWDYPVNWTQVPYNSQNYYWVRVYSTVSLTVGSQIDLLQYRKGSQYKVINLYKDVSVQAITSGLGGNVAANDINTLVSGFSNVDSVTNPAAFTDSREEETDLDRKNRFALYIQSLARATKGALEYAARTVEQVIAAKAIDDIRPWVFVCDASVFTDITSSMRNPGDAAVNILPSPADSGDALYIGATEPFAWLNMHLFTEGVCSDPSLAEWQYWNGTIWTALSGVTDGTSDSGPFTHSGGGTLSFTIPNDWVIYTVNSKSLMWIRLAIIGGSNVYSGGTPTGSWCSLPPGYGYVYLYVHDGSGEANAVLIAAVESAVELYKGCGIIVEVKSPVLTNLDVTATLLVAANYDPDATASDVEQGIIDWLNTFVLGQSFYLAELYQKIMDMEDKAIINVTITTPTSDVTVASASVIRPQTVTITGISI